MRTGWAKTHRAAASSIQYGRKIMERVNHRIARRAGLAAAILFSFATFDSVCAASDQNNPTAAPFLPAAALCASQSNERLPVTLAQWAEGAQLFVGLGDFHRPVSTMSKQAQAYFDQGMRFLWAFNHDEATRSFAQATQDDPKCAMCYWGVALTVGPNYNLPMMAAPRARVAWQALQLAEQNAGSASPVEQALIGALTKRYQGPQPLEPSNEGLVLLAYAEAMKGVAAKFPNDLDVQTLTAEAMMNTNAWKLWRLDGTPAPGTEAILTRLEGILAQSPKHPGANHYYIHAVEASPHPEKAVPAAEQLRGMMPAAGHLEHMPAHIMQRIGRYDEAAEANRKGAAADLAYFAKTKAPDYYPTMYTAHNYQFLALSMSMEGRKAETIDAGRKSRAVASDDIMLQMPGLDWPVTELYTGMVRFGLWDEILAEPAPNPRLRALTAGYLYARTMALAAKGRIPDAQAELAALQKLSDATGPDDAAGLNTAKDVFAVAILVARARIVAIQGSEADAITMLQQAVAAEDRLAYNEPADWFVPVRHVLGAALLKVGRVKDAEAVYREDLRRHPDNGWALYGLAQSLRAQGRDNEAAIVQDQFGKAWKNADIVLTSSAF
jgi:tetratricopeptide (TPR) repeat protein